MHDIHTANKILKKSLELAKKNNLKKINSITIELGKIVEHSELITPESLKYNINLISNGTILEKCEIIVMRKEKNNFIKLVEMEGE